MRYRRFRLPDARHYPTAVANSLGTALIDEAAFRGALLGLLIVIGMPVHLALAFQAIAYGLATRLGKPGRSRWMLLIFLGLGLVNGAVTLATGGIGAALMGHAITRFAIFVCTGHAGQVRPAGYEPEEEAAEHLPPPGWEVVLDGPQRAGVETWRMARGRER
ncbi:MAG: CPBP family intramembrane metalloprotease [Chloroflexi bacterium]|nr:CPBP family intramembrane metalloprotease [Chloroflexota bacterium]